MDEFLPNSTNEEVMEFTGSEGGYRKQEGLMLEVTNSTAIRVLDSLDRKIRAEEKKLIQQRVNAAILTVEIATFHDPQMRDLLAQNLERFTSLSNKIDKYRKILDQFSQEIRSCFPEDTGNPVQA